MYSNTRYYMYMHDAHFISQVLPESSSSTSLTLFSSLLKERVTSVLNDSKKDPIPAITARISSLNGQSVCTVASSQRTESKLWDTFWMEKDAWVERLWRATPQLC